MPHGTKMPARSYGAALCSLCSVCFERRSSRASICPECRPTYKRTWAAANADRLSAAAKARRESDPEAERSRARSRYLAEREKRIEAARARRLRRMAEDPEAVRLEGREHMRRWRQNNAADHRERRNVYLRNRRSAPRERLNYRIGNAVREALRGRKSGRRWETLLGFTLTDLMAHLERQFTEGMTWENMGEWHIDHIRPLASFSFESPGCADFGAAWALSNLRPLWAYDNMSKGARVTSLL